MEKEAGITPLQKIKAGLDSVANSSPCVAARPATPSRSPAAIKSSSSSVKKTGAALTTAADKTGAFLTAQKDKVKCVVVVSP